MRAKIKHADLGSSQLSWLCVQPMLISVRGKDVTAKTEVYHQLNEGQQALFLFYSYHNHTKSLAEFYWFSAYNIIEMKSWSGIRNGMRFFNQNEMVALLDNIERAIIDKNRIGDQWREVMPTDLEQDPNLYQSIEDLFNHYRTQAEEVIVSINNEILQHQEMYFEIEDEG
ncbi:hypothetical protein [Paenibacillus sp. ACRRY]|uniref:hypothetical protein n=1 Tax=Paenibacillus sp. ACRRY TaxID=2918208 RepID=UPI001EF5193F|nr:hypothetical protein [Paenibacillus sp. ACRRY]MCG7386811.1 hypothetical protein [Paenibacillus sp. ACRRY]